MRLNVGELETLIDITHNQLVQECTKETETNVDRVRDLSRLLSKLEAELEALR